LGEHKGCSQKKAQNSGQQAAAKGETRFFKDVVLIKHQL
jgi:hypothetical protein